MRITIETNRDAALVERFERAAGFLRGTREVGRRLAVDPDGFLVAREGAGRAVGACACLAWRDGGLAWIGGMYVLPEARGQGIARALLRACVAHAHRHGSTVVGLDASAMGRPLYAQEGFVSIAVTDRWRRPARAAPVEPPRPAPAAIMPVSLAELRDVAAYDRPRFGAGRAPWLAQVITDFPERAFAAYDRASGSMVGFALGQEEFVGPIVADEAAVAQWLLYACERSGTPPLVHVVDNNPAAVNLVQALGFEPQGQVLERMALGGPLPGRSETQFAAAAWALG